MILNSIFLHLDGRCHPQALCLQLKDHSRHISHCAQRAIRPLRTRTEGFNRIVIEPAQVAGSRPFINSAQVASLAVAFDAERFAQSTGDARSRYCADLLATGLTAFNEHIAIPLAPMLLAMDELAAHQFVDEWVHEHKHFRAAKLQAKLLCRMDSRAFSLTLRIQHAERLIFDEVVLSTPPDEVCFHNRFKSLRLHDGAIEVTQRAPHLDPLVRVPV